MTHRIAALLVVLVLMAAACGSDSTEGVASLEELPTTTPRDAAEVQLDTEQALLDFTQCMRDEGLDVDAPRFGAAGEFRLNMPIGEFMDRMGREESRAALNACSHLLLGVTQQFAGFDQTGMQDRLLVYAQCMRENGYEMADPDFSGGFAIGPGEGEGPGAFGDLDTDDPQFQAANEVCQSIFAGAFEPDSDTP